MRKLLILALALLAFPAHAQEIYRPVLNQTMTFDSVSRVVTNYQVGKNIPVLRLVCSQSCFVAFSPSALTWATVGTPGPHASSATGFFIPANTPEFVLNRQQSLVAVIALSTAGTLYITEMSK